jgi:hypothetical protein
MKTISEALRAVFISPEIVAGSLPFLISFYWSEPATFTAQQLASDTKWALGYSFGSEILSPSGTKKVLLSWPDYWKLKMRILVALGFCLLGFVFVLCGVYMVPRQNPVWGATIAMSGLFTAAAALASVALAKWSIREILPD